VGNLIIPPGYALVSLPLKHSALSRAAIVTWGIQLNDVPDFADANDQLTAYNDNFGSNTDDSVTMGPVTLRVGQDGGEALTVVGSATVDGGSAGSTKIAANSALLIHKHTARGGRRGRGRMYLPWVLAESSVTDTGVIDSTDRTAFQTHANDFLADVVAAGVVDAMVVLHTSGESTPGLPNVVTSLTVDGVIGTQRPRLGR
jgi:hypothetical protein